MRFADEVLAHFDAGFEHARGDSLEVVGDEASLWLADPWHCRTPLIERRREGAPAEWIETELIDSYRLEVENLSAAVRGEAVPLLGRADAVSQARAIEALYAAAASGCRVAP
jgi:predicted dehydrogenase